MSGSRGARGLGRTRGVRGALVALLGVATVDRAPGVGGVAGLLMSQFVGSTMARYIVVVEPLASRPAHEVAAAFAPTLQRYLTQPLH